MRSNHASRRGVGKLPPTGQIQLLLKMKFFWNRAAFVLHWQSWEVMTEPCGPQCLKHLLSCLLQKVCQLLPWKVPMFPKLPYRHLSSPGQLSPVHLLLKPDVAFSRARPCSTLGSVLCIIDSFSYQPGPTSFSIKSSSLYVVLKFELLIYVMISLIKF